MKNQFYLLLFLLILISSISLNSQSEINEGGKALLKNKIKQKVTNLIKDGNQFITYNLVESDDASKTETVLEKGTLLKVSKSELSKINQQKENQISLSIPYEDEKNIDLQLYKVDIFSENFSLKMSDNSVVENEDLGTHYRGVVKNETESLVSISIFDNEIFGLIVTKEGKYTIGKLDKTSNHIIYKNDEEETLSCDTAEDGIAYSASELSDANLANADNHCIEIAVEVDYDIYLNKGNATAGFITGLFNQSAAIFANDGINVLLSELYIRNNSSPYTGINASAMLSQFQAQTRSFTGDLAQLVSYKGSGGKAAGFDGFCNSSRSKSKCFSNIYPTYTNYPNYSWNVMVFTHELGHLMGSRHTHACVWNGNGTAIDGCSPWGVEGNCSLPGIPANGGTVMSYCHLKNVGINLNLGFGTQPRNVILNKINSSSCLNCEAEPPPPPPATCNLIKNGTFDDGLDNWTTYVNSAANASYYTGYNNAYIYNLNGGTSSWHVQLYQKDLNFSGGSRYIISFDVKANSNRSITVDVTRAVQPHDALFYAWMQVSASWERKYLVFETEADFNNARLVFNLGKSNVGIYFDNVKIEREDCFDECNLIQNSHLDSGVDFFNSYVNSAANAYTTYNQNEGTIDYTITNPGTLIWHVQLKQKQLAIEAGKFYTISYKAKSNVGRRIFTDISKGGQPHTQYFQYDQWIDQNWKNFNHTFYSHWNDDDVRLVFNIGKHAGNVSFDDIMIIERDCYDDTRLPQVADILETDVIVAPNPFTDYINIFTTESYKDATVQIYDIQGKLIVEDSFDFENNSLQTIQTNNLTNGIYIIKVQAPYENPKTFKIIKNEY